MPTVEHYHIDLGNGWYATNDAGGWRGIHTDGRRTLLHTNINVVQQMIERGWIEGVESPIAPKRPALERITTRHV